MFCVWPKSSGLALAVHIFFSFQINQASLRIVVNMPILFFDKFIIFLHSICFASLSCYFKFLLIFQLSSIMAFAPT